MYFIATIRTKDRVVDDQRCVGFVRHYSTAHKQIMRNACDIFEDGYYRYAVIVKIGPGLYPDVEEVQWFERYVDGTIATIDRPKRLDRWYPYVIG